MARFGGLSSFLLLRFRLLCALLFAFWLRFAKNVRSKISVDFVIKKEKTLFELTLRLRCGRGVSYSLRLGIAVGNGFDDGRKPFLLSA